MDDNGNWCHMIERFSGPNNRDRLVDEICRQALVQGDRELAGLIADELELTELDAGTEFVSQGGVEDDLFFILSGRVSVAINGREIAVRSVGEHVGEMSLLDPSSPRIASLVTIDKTVLGKLSESAFRAVATQHPGVWRMVAMSLGHRLRQRTRFISIKNPRPVIFIGSSSESLAFAGTLKAELESGDCLVHLWTENIFSASSFAIVDLEEQIRTSDFAVLILTPDDTVTSRTVTTSAPRDNVVFELGLFMGAITHSRTFLLIPKDSDVKIPSDLLGLKPLTYDLSAAPDSYLSVASVIKEILRLVAKIGPK